MSPFCWIDWLLAKLRPKPPVEVVVAEVESAAIPAKAATEGRVVMIHTEALALQAKIHAEATDLLAKASQVGAIVSQAISEGRTALSEDEAKLVSLFDSKTVLLAKVQQFLSSL
jgi:hypothetical protein